MEGLMLNEDDKEMLFVSVRPYVADARAIREFLDSADAASFEELGEEIQKRVGRSSGTLKTDFKILHDKWEKMRYQKK
jgi:hypothetical protein